MMDQLDSMDLSELKALRKQVEKAIESFETRRKKAALEALEATAKEQGFSLSELLDAAGATKTRGQAAAPKFANPHNPDETWSGRGRKPRWFIEAIEAGKTPDDLAI
ncbi:H-NS family nucleoid-associated regulatory protein [Falsirhodobacter sp. 1013]|uniref:H-NS histone family protein n=1 Tax=Falsirhodobacter sp. 1013 TaxID=3417566 RepID=UPI003EBE89BD